MILRLPTIAAAIAFISPIALQTGTVQAQIAPVDDALVMWQVAAPNQPIPATALPGGHEQGQPTALCAAEYQGAREIGRVVGGNCSFGHAGVEVRQSSYELLLGNAAALRLNPQFVRWVPAQNGLLPPGAFVAAREGEKLLPVCHAPVQGGVVPGKVVGNACKVAFGGKEVAVPQYEVLVASRLAANIPTQALSAAATNPQNSAPAARGVTVGGIGGISALDIQGMDLETAMMAVQSQRANLLETQLKTQLEEVQKRNDQIAKLNQQITQLRADRAKLRDPMGADLAAASAIDKQVETIKGQIDSMNNSQQMDMLRMQSLTNKRNEAFDLMSNFIKKMADSRSSILGNMR